MLGDTIFFKTELEPFKNVSSNTFKNMRKFDNYRKDRNLFLKGLTATTVLSQSNLNFAEDPEGTMLAIGKAIVAGLQLDPVNFLTALV